MKTITILITLLALISLMGCTLDNGTRNTYGGATYLAGERQEEDNMEDVEEHDTSDSCYTTINERVYDITDYIDFSTEYKDIGMDKDEFRNRLTSSCGTDGTTLFEELFGDNHMRLDSYLVDA
jgi:hypothetical protein